MTTRRNPAARTTRTTLQRLQLALAYVPLKNPTSVLEHWRLLEAGAADILQPDAPRVGGITPFNQIAALALHEDRMLVPDRPGLGLTLSDHAQAWTTQRWES